MDILEPAIQSQGINVLPLSSDAHLDNNHHDLEACDFHPFAKSLEQCMISSSSLQTKSYAFDVSQLCIPMPLTCTQYYARYLWDACASKALSQPVGARFIFLYSLRNGLTLGYIASVV